MSDLLRKILFLPEAASSWASRVDRLHFFVVITTMAAATAVGLVAVAFVIRYRRRPGQTATPRVSSPLWFEVLTIAGTLSLFLLWFGIGFRDYVWLRSPPRDSMDVYVMGKQWMWKFSYPGGPSAVGELTIPQGRPVRLLLTSRDVIHSFFVPAFRVKQDALPGRYTEVWFTATETGRFEVLCAEYCGTSHSEMRAEVVVLPANEFDAWLAGQRARAGGREDAGGGPAATLVEQGREAAVSQGCLKCHSVDGSAHIGPTWKGLYRRQTPLEGGGSVVADEGYLTESMMDPLAKISAGFQPVMPTYQGQLSGPDAAAIVEYIKSLGEAPEAAPQPEGPAR